MLSVTVPDAAVAFELINGDGLWKLADSIKADQVEDGVDDGFRYAVFFCHSSKRLHFRQWETDVDVEKLRDVEWRMKPFRMLHESTMEGLAGKNPEKEEELQEKLGV